MKVLHLDFKGLQPTFEHLLELLPIFQDAGYEALLMEWEDTFPWTVNKKFRSANAYTEEQVLAFNQEAANCNLEIIPLVQCLGHMEIFLGISDYKSLREQSEYSDVINPLAEGTEELITSLIKDILRLSPNVKYFHIGGDEAVSLGSHPETRKFCKTHSLGELYIKHITPFCDLLNANNIRPLIWHDMLIEWDDKDLYLLKEKADIVFWGYAAPVHSTDSHYNIKYIRRFSELGLSLWGATAYKGADGNTADFPNLEKRVKNAESWSVADRELGFKGIFVTGWSRYSTHRVQCELLDTALDSMFIVSDILSNGTTLKESESKFTHYMRDKNMIELFNSMKMLMQRFSEQREFCWLYVRYLLEQITLENMKPGKKSSHISVLELKNLKSSVELLAEIGAEMITSFNSFVVFDCLEEYVTTRIGAIERQINLIQRIE